MMATRRSVLSLIGIAPLAAIAAPLRLCGAACFAVSPEKTRLFGEIGRHIKTQASQRRAPLPEIQPSAKSAAGLHLDLLSREGGEL